MTQATLDDSKQGMRVFILISTCILFTAVTVQPARAQCEEDNSVDDYERQHVVLDGVQYIAALVKVPPLYKHGFELQLLNPTTKAVVARSQHGPIGGHLRDHADWFSLGGERDASAIRFDRALGMVAVFHTSSHMGETIDSVFLFGRAGDRLIERGSIELHSDAAGYHGSVEEIAAQRPAKDSDMPGGSLKVWSRYDAKLQQRAGAIVVRETVTYVRRPAFKVTTLVGSRTIRRKGVRLDLGGSILSLPTRKARR